MIKRRMLADGNVFLELRGDDGDFIAEAVVTRALEARMTTVLADIFIDAEMAARPQHSGVLRFHRGHFPFEVASPRRSRERPPARG